MTSALCHASRGQHEPLTLAKHFQPGGRAVLIPCFDAQHWCKQWLIDLFIICYRRIVCRDDVSTSEFILGRVWDLIFYNIYIWVLSHIWSVTVDQSLDFFSYSLCSLAINKWSQHGNGGQLLGVMNFEPSVFLLLMDSSLPRHRGLLFSLCQLFPH